MCSGLFGTVLCFTPLYFVLFGPHKYEHLLVSAGGLFLLLLGRYISKHAWRIEPASDAQKAAAQDLGIEFRPDVTAGRLSALIEKAAPADDD